jgi:hypothetical protein
MGADIRSRRCVLFAYFHEIRPKSVLFASTGLTQLAFIPNQAPLAIDDWPTLGEMINAGKRLVVFLDEGANTTEVPFLLPEFQMVRTIVIHSVTMSNLCL